MASIVQVFSVQELTAPSDLEFHDLGELLFDSVASGASVNFIQIPDLDVAEHWWRDALQDSENMLFVARAAAGKIIGCVRLMPATQPNGHHRAEVGKLLVLQRARGQGVATELMTTLETRARELGRTLLMLDTETGSYAEGFYRARGWIEYGQLSDHTYDPKGELSGTTFFAKRL